MGRKGERKPCARCGGLERTKQRQCKRCAKTDQQRPDRVEKRKAYWSKPENKERERKRRQRPEIRARIVACKDSPEYREWQRKYSAAEETKLRARARKYNVTVEELRALYKSQDGQCASCGDALDPHQTDIDHDHATGVVRGILCHSCNLAEGQLRGSSLRARKLAAYIDKHAPTLKGIK